MLNENLLAPGVPETTHEILKMVSVVRTLRSHSDKAIIVHCSAGIGRTGVFIALDIAVNKLFHKKYVSFIYILIRG